MTTQRFYHEEPGNPRYREPSRTLSSAPSKSVIIHTLRTTIDDLQLLQRTIKAVLEQEAHGDEAERELEQTLKYAQESEMQARRDLEALTNELGE